MKRTFKQLSISISLFAIFLVVNSAYGQTNVNVVNSNSSPVPVVNVNDAVNPVHDESGFTQLPGTNVSVVDIFTVPMGKRLVIEYIDMTAQLPANQRISSFKITTVVSSSIAHFRPLVFSQPAFVNGDPIFGASQIVKFYADAGTQVKAIVIRSSNVGSASISVAVSGYLVDMP